MIDDVLRELESVGQVDSHGEFTLDRVKAREKMRRFQLADPRAYVLELVQAAALKGATKVVFAIDANDMVMELDGRPFTTADFDDIYGAALTHRLDLDVLARRQLALGVNSAMALHPRFITVESGDGQRGARLRLRPDEEDAYEAIETTRVGTRIHVRERFSLGTFAAFFRNLAGTLAEEQLLRERCGHASFTIELEGKRLDRGLVLDDGAVLDRVTHERGSTRLVCGLRPEGSGPPQVRIVKDGVWITTHDLPVPPFAAGFIAVAEDHAVRKEVSQADIVRDAAYVALVGVLLEGCDMARAALARRQLVGEAPSWAEAELERRFEDHARSGAAAGDPDEPTGLVRALRRLPLWRTTLGSAVSLDDAFAELGARGGVAFTPKSGFHGLQVPERSFVLHLPPPPDSIEASQARRAKKKGGGPVDRRKRILELVLGARFHDVTPARDAARARERARLAWRSRPTAAVLPEGAYLCRRAFAGPGVQGELGLTAQPIERATLSLVVDGCLLVEQPLKLPWLGLRIVVAAAAFVPNAGYDRVERTRESYAALLHAAHEIPSLYGALAQVTEATQWRDACAMSFLEALLRRDSLVTALFPLSSKESDASLDAAVAAAGGAATFMLDAGLRASAPHPTTAMPLFRALGPWRPSLVELVERARAKTPIRAVPKPVPGIEAEILVLDLEAQARLQPLLGRPFEDASVEVRQRLRERDFLGKPIERPAFLTTPGVVLVPIEGEGITGVLQIVPSRRPAASCAIEVLHQQRALDTVRVVLAGECRGWIESIAIEPTKDYRRAKKGEALDHARAAVLRAFAAGCLRVAKRGAALSSEDLAFLREVLALPFPGRFMRPAYDRLREPSDAKPGEVAELYGRLLAALHTEQDSATLEDRLKRLASSKTALADGRSIPAPERSQGWALAAVDVLFPAGDDPHDMAARTLRPTPPLGELPLFRRHDGRPLCLAEIREAVAHRKTLLHTHEPNELELGDRTMVLVDPPQLELLRAVLGRRCVLDGRGFIAQRRRSQELASREKVAKLALPPGAALVSVRVELAKGWRGLEGEVGLRCDHPGDPFYRPQLRIAAHLERARIETLELDEQAAHLIATVNDDRLALAPDHQSLVRNSAFDELVRQCHAHVPELVALLVTAWPQLTPSQQQAAWYHLLDFLVAHPSATLEQWGHAGAQDETFARVAEVPGFTIAGGERRSALELVQAYLRHGRIEVLRGSWSVWGDSPLPRDRPVPCVDPYERAALGSLLPQVESVEERWPTWQARERNRDAAPLATAVPEDRVLVAQGLEIPGLEGQLAIVTGLPLTIELCVEGKVITAWAIDEVLPCWGSVSGSMITPNETWTYAVLDPKVGAALRGRSLELYGKLARWFDANPGHAEHGRVASLLADQVLALRHVERWRPLPKAEARLLDELREVPVLALANGRRISLAIALDKQPDELGHLDLWDAPAHRLQQLYGALVPAVAPAPAPMPAPAPAPAPAPRPPTLEEQLVDALRAELGLVRGQDQRLLANEHLERILVRPLAGAQRRLVACANAAGVIVNRDHPVVKRALAQLLTDPVWCSFVASAVYTALNVWLEEISDADERSFHGHMARLVGAR